MLQNIKRIKTSPMTKSWAGEKTADTHGNWWFKATTQRFHFSFWKTEDTNSGHVKPRWKNMSVSSFCFSSSSHPTASGDPSQPMNPVTSALISGVVILGGVSMGLFLVSVRLLQKSRLLTTRASGVWNPSFKWINICIWWHLGTDNIYTDVKKKKKR